MALVFVPFFPTFWYLLAVAFTFGAIDGFVHLTVSNLAILAGLFVLSILVDWSAGLLGAKFGGAAWKSLLFGALGALIGLLIVPPLGIFVGLFAGVVAGELLRRKELADAFRAAGGALIGTFAGILINALIALAFVISFIVFAVA